MAAIGVATYSFERAFELSEDALRDARLTVAAVAGAVVAVRLNGVALAPSPNNSSSAYQYSSDGAASFRAGTNVLAVEVDADSSEDLVLLSSYGLRASPVRRDASTLASLVLAPGQAAPGPP